MSARPEGAEPAAELAEPRRPGLGPLRSIGRGAAAICSDAKARVGVILVSLFVLVAAFAPWIAPYSASDASFAHGAGPDSAHWLGTTAAGQDVLSQILVGARVSVFVGLLAGALATGIALLIGMTWGYTRSLVGDVLNFLVNLFLIIPALPLMIVIAAYAQNGGLTVIVLVIVITGWAWGARVLRAQTQTLRSRDFITAARFSGERAARITFREILPNMISLIVANFFAAATAAVIAEAGLEFLGLGNTTTVSWGTMLFWAQNSDALLTGQWVLLLAPGLCIAVFAAAMTLIIFGVDGLSNPQLREVRSR
jgi:peptide/nickel transport system permease protein